MSLFVRRGQRIAVVGANGMGKSTLIKTISGEIPLISGEIKIGYNVVIAHYNQDQFESLDMKANVFENLRRSSETISDFEARSLLGSFLFKGDDVYKTAGILSGGEKSRLSLACMLAKNANLLLLDEPTNHLDILSTEILINALVEYEGTVIFVSHNRTFIDSVATDIFDISEEIKYGNSKK
jgi:ATP-binding cassette subfamily F protein 3